MYHPNFCSECGEKILRVRWHIWHSRRFCDHCARRFIKPRLILPTILAVILLGGGLLVGRALRPAPPPLIIERRADSPLNDSGGATKTADRSTATTSTQPSLSEEVVYICGARTKKGTPCSRRVHGPVRCWQHKGLPAMLSPDKLVVKESQPE
jgi:hypothetical protein